MHLKKKQKVENKRVPLTLRVASEVKMFCTHQTNASALVERLITESREFREWSERIGEK